MIQRYKFQNLLDKYDDLYSLDLFGETIEGHRNVNPYEGETIINRHVDEDRKNLTKSSTIEGFEDLEGIE